MIKENKEGVHELRKTRFSIVGKIIKLNIISLQVGAA
jgi:hypothetical protein